MLLRRKLIRHDSYSRCRLYACPGRIARHFYLLAWCRLHIYTASPSSTASEGCVQFAGCTGTILSVSSESVATCSSLLVRHPNQRQLYSELSGRGKCCTAAGCSSCSIAAGTKFVCQRSLKLEKMCLQRQFSCVTDSPSVAGLPAYRYVAMKQPVERRCVALRIACACYKLFTI